MIALCVMIKIGGEIDGEIDGPVVGLRSWRISTSQVAVVVSNTRREFLCELFLSLLAFVPEQQKVRC